MMNFTLTSEGVVVDGDGPLFHFFRLCAQTRHPLFRAAFGPVLLRHDPTNFDVVGVWTL